LAFTPDLYRCGIAFSGMANLADFARAMPPYWGPIRNRWVLRVGNVTADEALNRQISPVFHAHNIRVSLLMGTGGNDVRVTQVRLMQHRGTAVDIQLSCTQRTPVSLARSAALPVKMCTDGPLCIAAAAAGRGRRHV
jgi:hypothetical protein